jgi:hypothetical protein
MRRSREEWSRTPTLAGQIKRLNQDFATALPPVRILGYDSTNIPVTLSEEDREAHIHILGAPGEGKSKFLELLIRQDIERGYGACLLDPSIDGQTANNILRYCASIGFEKVCYINPIDFLEFDRVPVIQPIKYKAPPRVTVGNTLDAISVLWGSTWRETPRIVRYVRAIVDLLRRTYNTFAEVKYFLSPLYTYQRHQILADIPDHDFQKDILAQAYRTPSTFEQFQSTINRLAVFDDDLIKLSVGSKMEYTDFTKFIKDGWLVLCNLYPRPVWGDSQLEQRLLGTLIIGEITYALSRLRAHGWRGIYYLYIDELGDYATEKIAHILDKERKSGLRFTMAHQRFDQIDDKNILSALRSSTKTKVMFYTPNDQDLHLMMKDIGYGGDLPDRQVAYELRKTAKQSAAISIGKQNPRITRILDVPDAQVSDKQLKAFKELIYARPWYHSAKEITNEINARFDNQQPRPFIRPARAKRPPAAKVRPASPTDAPPIIQPKTGHDDQGQDKGSVGVRAVPVDSPGRPPVLRRAKGRATRKILEVPPKEK